MPESIFSMPGIAVAGMGKEGCATVSWLRRRGYRGEIIAADLHEKLLPEGIDKVFFGETYLEDISKIPLIFRSPGISLDQLFKAGCPRQAITSQSEIILAKCKVIGVTGTKGKSTVSSLIYHILRKAKIPCHLAGNLGLPFFDLPDEAWDELIVAELSSHQLIDVHNSPHIAVLLGIVPEHLDYYDCFESYHMAKTNIYLHQTKNDILITSPECKHGRQAIAQAMGTVITIGQSWDEDFVATGKEVFYSKQNVIDTSFLRGRHNAINVAAALAACFAAGIPVGDAAFYATDFKPLPYRLETVAIIDGIEFVDDPLATAPEALVAAIKAFDGKIGAIICGGHERNQDYTNVADAIVASGVKILFAFPTTGERIAREVTASAKSAGKSSPNIIFTSSMEEAVRAVTRQCSPGDVCLHSPGAPSFGLYIDYKDRSKAFRDAIKQCSQDNLRDLTSVVRLGLCTQLKAGNLLSE